MRSRLLLPVPAVLLLAACQGEPADEGGAASGEVLEGTISDAMLPLDTVRSQPPLAEPSVAASARASDGATDAAEGEDGEPVAGEGAAANEAAPEAAEE